MSWIPGLEGFIFLQQGKGTPQLSPRLYTGEKYTTNKKKPQSGKDSVPTHSGLREGSGFWVFPEQDNSVYTYYAGLHSHAKGSVVKDK